MVDLGYPVEKFSLAASGLAVSHKSLQERIADVFADGLINVAGHTGLPTDVAERFQAYQSAWSAVGETSGEGQIYVWARGLSIDDAMDIARWIVDTATRLRDEHLGVT